MTKFAIVTTTYWKPDGSTHDQLVRTINGVLDQKYENWKLFLIGDRYDDEDEFNRIADLVPEEKIFKLNRVNETIERDLYPNPSKRLWCSGGGTSRRFGIEQALKQGFEYICPLDHDDYWSADHLLTFATAIKTHPEIFFLISGAKYRTKTHLPPVNTSIGLGYYPQPYKIVHSSTCIKFSETDLRTRDVHRTCKTRPVPSDFDLWKRLRVFMMKNNKQGYYTGQTTCYKEADGATLPRTKAKRRPKK